jgi:hypothetical protein
MLPQPEESLGYPTPSEILGQIGWVLLVHVAIAAEVVRTMQFLGYA